MKILYSIVIISLAAAACTANESQDKTSDLAPEAADQSEGSEQQLAIDPYAEYFQLNAEANQEVVGVVITRRSESDAKVTADNDADGDGSLNEEERGKAGENIRSRAAEIKQEIINSLVVLADEDGDGTVTPEEILALLQAKRQEFTDAINAKNEELRLANKELHEEVRLACTPEVDAPADEDITEELIDQDILNCDEAKKAAKAEQIASLAEKRNLVKDSIAEIQVIVSALQMALGEDPNAAEAEDKDKGKGKDKDKDKDA